MMIEEAIADYDPMPDWGTGSAGSYRNLPTNELSYSEREAEWRVEHAPTGSCYLKVWLIERFTPLVGSVVDTPISPYVWNGTGNPCWAAASLPPDHEDNRINGSGHSLAVPTTNGTKTIIVEKYSCVPDYEPDLEDPTKPNGYPNP